MLKKSIVIIFLLSVMNTFADKAEDILNKLYDSRGGLEKLQNIENIYAEGRVFYAMNKEWTSMKYWAKGPKKVKIQQIIQTQKVEIAYNGKILWQINPFMGFSTPNIPQSKQAAIMKPQIEQLRAILKGITVQNSIVEKKYEGEEKFLGRDAHVVNVTTSDYFAYDLYIDTKTFQLLKFETKSIDSNRGEEITTEVVFTKYFTKDGINFPKEYEVIINGNMVQKSELINLEINKSISDNIFAKP